MRGAEGLVGQRLQTRAATRCQSGSMSVMPPAPCTSGSITSAASRTRRPPAPPASCLPAAWSV